VFRSGPVIISPAAWGSTATIPFARIRAWSILLTHRRLYSRGADPPQRVGDRFVVDAAEHRLEAAVDGEPDVLETPVEFRIEPRVLRVLVPPT